MLVTHVVPAFLSILKYRRRKVYGFAQGVEGWIKEGGEEWWPSTIWELLAQSLPWLVRFAVSQASMIPLSCTGAQRANREFCGLCPPLSRRGSFLSPSPQAAPHLVLHLVGTASLPACSIIPVHWSRPPAGARGRPILPPLRSLPPPPWLVQLASMWPCVLCSLRSAGLCVYEASQLCRSHLPTVGCRTLDHLMLLRVGGFPLSLTGWVGGDGNSPPEFEFKVYPPRFSTISGPLGASFALPIIGIRPVWFIWMLNKMRAYISGI